eukprot:TRINITY_DN7295_c0_g1_i2.p2 TRINITY_DN7295_c0_g1~~TRINITY_DN7295_c0_g1_i2.p2  ORF type:complete len:106 (-),score=31.06 TRINITY_DN7295_c0_g1_i2:9-326(-)
MCSLSGLVRTRPFCFSNLRFVAVAAAAADAEAVVDVAAAAESGFEVAEIGGQLKWCASLGCWDRIVGGIQNLLLVHHWELLVRSSVLGAAPPLSMHHLELPRKNK